MLIAVLSGVLISMILLLLRFSKGWYSLLTALFPGALFIYFLSYLPDISAGKVLRFNYQWIPSLNVNLDFQLDGLSMLFCLLITGIGMLIFVYTAYYLKGDPQLNKLYSYLSLFLASMLGLVLADNLLMIFLFWELTSISSFFLIGFNNKDESARKSSLVALAITGGGGYLLLAGFILIGHIGHTYSIEQLLTSRELLQHDTAYLWILIFVFGGAFTKSAQFPFHFWLPGAMKAPTPVSAYLHSATMVNAGIYLIARLSPVLGDHIYWNSILMIIGGLTMLYGAFHSTLRIDLKGILAYTTISALGLIVFLLGIGTKTAMLATCLFILVHALYKAALFLVTGIIDHQTKTRDVTLLRGLKKVMLPVAIAGVLAALSSAGIPFTVGFIGKDLIYEATMNTASYALWLTAAALIAKILLGYSGYVAGIKPFFGQLPEKYSEVKMPSPLLWIPPVILVVASLIFGFVPFLMEPILFAAVKATGVSAELPALKIWHGFNPVLLLSGVTIVLSIVLYGVKKTSSKHLLFISKFDKLSPSHLVFSVSRGFSKLSSKYTKTMQSGYLRIYMIIIICFLMALLAYRLITGIHFQVDLSTLTPISIYEVVILLIMVTAIAIIIFTASRLTSIIAMSIVGYSICLLFVFYGAPDLAMTQFTIDTLTVVLFMLVLLKLPPFLNLSDRRIKIRDGIISVGFGTIIAVIALMVLQEPTHKEISQFYAQNAYTIAKGKNVVNVILVDFRGADTLIEITVLTIAAIGVYSMLKLRINSTEKE